MQLKWPFVLLVLLVVPVIAIWRWRHAARRPVRPVAETSSASGLPSYATVQRRARRLAAIQTTVLMSLLIVLAIIAARPQQNIRKVNTEHSRDIVFCLDASRSMQIYLPAALTTMTDIVEANPTDRYALVIFQNVPYVALPLTSDVAAITLKTNDFATQFQASADGTLNAATFAGFQPDQPGGGTDIGAGLAGCIRRFDSLDQPRSRHIIMLSDMDHNGVIDQTAVASLLTRYNIALHVLAPPDTNAASSPVVQIASAQVDSFDDEAGVRRTVTQIMHSIQNAQASIRFVSVDTPYPWWLAATVLAALWTGVQLLRWRQRP